MLNSRDSKPIRQRDFNVQYEESIVCKVNKLSLAIRDPVHSQRIFAHELSS